MNSRPYGLPLSHYEIMERKQPEYIKACKEFAADESALFKACSNAGERGREVAASVLLFAAYINSGRRHFHINRDLVWLLSQTSAEVMFDAIMPFDVIYLSFDFEGRGAVDGHELIGVYVAVTTPPHAGTADINVSFKLCWEAHGIQIMHLRTHPGHAVTLDDWVKEVNGDFGSVKREEVVDIMALVLNALLYISTPNAVRYKPSEVLTDKQKKRVGKSPRRKRQLEKLDQSVVILGPEARASRISRAPHQGGTVRSHLRRGHWRRQWVGSKLDQDGNKRLGEKQVPLWVLPTWVSGDGKPAVKTKYIVK